MKHFASVVASVALRLLGVGVLGLLGLALYVSVGRQLVPLIAEYRAEVQARASEALQLPLAIGELRGRWEGFAPRLIARDVRVGEGATAMHLERVVVVPDVFASLWGWELRLSALEFDRVQLGLSEDADGHWHIEGLPERADQPLIDPQKILATLQQIQRVALLDSQLTLSAHGASPLTLTYANLELRSAGEKLRLDGRVVLPDGKPLALQAKAKVRPQDWRRAELKAYLSLPQSDWAAWLPPALTADWRLERLHGGGEAWLAWADERLERAVVRLHVPHLAGAYGERETASLENLAVTAYASREGEDYRVQFEGLAFSQGESRWSDARLLLSRQAEPQVHWRLQADRLGLAPLAPLAEALLPLPDEAQEYLGALRPGGNLRNLQLDYRPDDGTPARLAFAASFEAVEFADYHAVPAITNASGSIRGDLGGGEVRIDSRDFSLHLAQLFPEPWHYRRGGGRLTWHRDEQGLTLAAPYLQVDGEEGQLAGDFLIRLLHDPAAEDYLDLRIGLRQGDARYTRRYLPTRLPVMGPALVEWLQTAIRGGTIDQGYFQYQGALHGEEGEAAHSLSLYFQVHDAELAYQPGWPALRGARGEVLIEDSGVRVRLDEGRILDSRVHGATADIPHVEGKTPRLAIKGQVTSSLGDGLKLLREAPIGTEALFAGWEGSGALKGALALDIPLAHGEKPRVRVDFSSTAATLHIPDPNLRFEQLSGTFRYDLDKGLSAEKISAQVLGRPVQGRAIASGQSGSPVTRIEAQGSVTLERLAKWLAIKQPLPAQGELPYQLSLTLGGKSDQLQIDSSLLGLAIDLPAPFGKTAKSRRDTSLRMDLQGPERRYWIRHGDLAALAFAAPPGNFSAGRGELRLGPGPANLPLAKGLRIIGRLDRLDLGAWQAALEPYASAGDPGDLQLLSRAQVDIGRLEGFGTRIDGLSLDLARAGANWSLGLQSRVVAGKVRVADAKGVAVTVALDHLRLPEAASADSGGRKDPLADVDPGSLPALDIAIDRLYQGDTLLGAWAFKMRPQGKGVAFHDLALDLKGLKLDGSGGWADGQSWYKGRLHGDNLADVLVAWGMAPSVTSESFSMAVDGRWPGSPAWIGLERFSGTLQPRLRKGQLVEMDGSAQALRVFGLLNFNAIGRRLRLDFSDLFAKGLSYDRFKGTLIATDGVYRTSGPLSLTGPSANLEFDGTLNMVSDRVDAKVVVALPLSNNLPLAALIVGAPAIGGALFVVDKLLGDKTARFASVQYRVEGPWQSPKITFDKPFD